MIVHSHLEVPVSGRPGRHELSAGRGEETVNIAPQLTRLEPANSSILPTSFRLRLYNQVFIQSADKGTTNQPTGYLKKKI